MNKVQKSAYELIQSDARYIYNLVEISQTKSGLHSNYICMSLPYIGIFADGSEQWARKVGLKAPQFNESEKLFYQQVRERHKLFEHSYDEFLNLLMKELKNSDEYFYKKRSGLEKLIGYSNIGTDICKGKYTGNTALCALYLTIPIFEDEKAKEKIRDISVIVGRLADYYECQNLPKYHYNDHINVHTQDFHFFKRTPLKMNNELGFVLFSILCSVNFAVEFIENYFIEEIPQKFKFAYLQYFYLCGFINDLNVQNGTNFYLDRHLYREDFRNCLAHYGLGQFIEESELVPNDLLKGLTIKAFGKDYYEVKEELYGYLRSLTSQIELEILK